MFNFIDKPNPSFEMSESRCEILIRRLVKTDEPDTLFTPNVPFVFLSPLSSPLS